MTSRWLRPGETLERIGWREAYEAITKQGWRLGGKTLAIEGSVHYYLTNRSLELLNEALSKRGDV